MSGPGNQTRERHIHVYMHAHAHTDTQIYGSQEVQEAFEQSHQCRELQLTSQPLRKDGDVGRSCHKSR